MDLREIIQHSESRRLNRHQRRKLIDVCHSLALAYLRMKAGSGKLYMIHDEHLNDLAWDFIADLFEQNQNGELVKINTYFEGTDVTRCKESGIIIELRKLVFSKVDDNIYHTLGSKDPSLRKIIRNLKLAIDSAGPHESITYDDGFLMLNRGADTRLPAMPSEFMQMKLCSRLNGKMQIPEILTNVVSILEEQNQYRTRFSVVALATIIRESYVYMHEYNDLPELNEKERIDRHVFSGEFESFLKKSALLIRSTSGKRYVNNGKISEKELDIYMKVSINIIRDQFINGKKKFSQFEHLKQLQPDVDHHDFRNDKRQVLEYLVAQIKEDLIETYRKDWLYS